MPETWSWSDYERQYGRRPSASDDARDEQRQPMPLSPRAADDPPADGPLRSPSAGGEGHGYYVLLPPALAERLKPHAEKRGISIERLVNDLIEIELDGELIDITLDGDSNEVAPQADGEEPAGAGGEPE